MRKINILQIINSIEHGGTEIQLLYLLRNINRQKYNVMVCALGSGTLEKDFRETNVPVKVIKSNFHYDITLIFRLVRFMQHHKIDIVHTYLSLADIFGRFAAKIAGVPIIISGCRSANTQQKKISMYLMRIANKFTDIVISNSNAGKEFVINTQKLKANKISVVYNGIDFEKYSKTINIDAKKREIGIESNNFVVGTVARLDPLKGVNYFLEAASKVAQSIPNIVFIVVGEGPQRLKLEELSRRLGIVSKTIFTGYRKDVAELAQIFDVSVLSSVVEGMPNAIIESMALGKPVVASNVGGVPEIVKNGQNGILVPPGDVESLANAIIRLLLDKRLAYHLSQEAKQYVEKCYPIDLMVKKVENVYDALIASKIRGVHMSDIIRNNGVCKQ
ncbi:glycosyltransferase [bacterium]|nr:glycosyltransferase [bacterium]